MHHHCCIIFDTAIDWFYHSKNSFILLKKKKKIIIIQENEHDITQSRISKSLTFDKEEGKKGFFYVCDEIIIIIVVYIEYVFPFSFYFQLFACCLIRCFALILLSKSF